MKTVNGWLINEAGQTTPWSVQEEANFTDLVNLMPAHGQLVTNNHRHSYAYGPLNPDAQIICTDTAVYLAAGTNSFGISNLDDHAFLKGYLRLGDAGTPLGILHVIKETGITDTDTGINVQAGNVTATSGVFTRDNTYLPIILSDCGTLGNTGVLKIIDRGTHPVTLPWPTGHSVNGFGFVSSTNPGDSQEQIFFRFTDAGVVSISKTANASVTAGTPNNLNVYSTVTASGISTKLFIENLLGATETISYFVWYASCPKIFTP